MDESEQKDSDRNSPPLLPPDSPGSSVSSRLQEEYSELLRYAVVLPPSETQGATTDLIQSTLEEPTEQRAEEQLNLSQSSLKGKAQTVSNEGDRNTNAEESNALSRPASQTERPVTGTRRVSVTKENHSTDQAEIADRAVKTMDCKLNGWLGDLKTNILDELRRSCLQTMDCQKKLQEREINDLQCEKQQLQQQVNCLSEMVHTCKQSLARKDTLVENLTTSLAQQKERCEASKNFFNWRSCSNDEKREAFTSKLATKHHERKLNLRVFKAWFGIVQGRWRDQCQRQSQNHAQNVCKQLSTDYEAKIAQLHCRIQELENDVESLQKEKETYADSVKKAFMRGVCALNMEAMSAFTSDDQGPPSDDFNGLQTTNLMDLNSHNKEAQFHDANFNSSTEFTDKPDQMPSDHMVTPGPDLISQPIPNVISSTSHPIRKTKNTKNKPDSRPKSGSSSLRSSQHPVSGLPGMVLGQSLAPPMASVVVERHQPVTKQTVGKATAVKYPKSSSAQNVNPRSAKFQPRGPQTYLPLAGQTLKPTQSIKVVE